MAQIKRRKVSGRDQYLCQKPYWYADRYFQDHVGEKP